MRLDEPGVGVLGDEVTIAQVADDWTDPILDALDRAVTARTDGTVPADRVVDIQYATLVVDPLATIRELYAHWDLELRPEVAGRMRAFLEEHGQHRHGVHRYAFGDTGQSAERIRDRSRRYREYFDVPEEPLAGI